MICPELPEVEGPIDNNKNHNARRSLSAKSSSRARQFATSTACSSADCENAKGP